MHRGTSAVLIRRYLCPIVT